MRDWAAPLVPMQVRQFPEPSQVAHRVLVHARTVAVRRSTINTRYLNILVVSAIIISFLNLLYLFNN